MGCIYSVNPVGIGLDLALDETEGLVCDCIMLLNTARSFKPMVC